MSLKSLIAQVTEKIKPDTPSPYKLADNEDELDWNRARYGLFAENDTDDDVIKTVPFKDGE